MPNYIGADLVKMNDANLIESLIQTSYDSGYYSGKREDGSPQHLEAIRERGRLGVATLQRLADLRAALEAIVREGDPMTATKDWPTPELFADWAIQQARAALATEAGE